MTNDSLINAWKSGESDVSNHPAGLSEIDPAELGVIAGGAAGIELAEAATRRYLSLGCCDGFTQYNTCWACGTLTTDCTYPPH